MVISVAEWRPGYSGGVVDEVAADEQKVFLFQSVASGGDGFGRVDVQRCELRCSGLVITKYGCEE